MGVQIDSKTVSDKLYEELNDDRNPANNDVLPEDRINARLANRKWLNETEHKERVQFVTNFIRSAYERGYEVELDSNLVVVGVRKIDPSKKVDIDKVIKQVMARQGQ